MTEQEFKEKVLSLDSNLRKFAKSFYIDINDVEDLVQDTYLKAWKYKDNYKPIYSIKTWVFEIMKNNFRDNYRMILAGKRDKKYLLINFKNNDNIIYNENSLEYEEIRELFDNCLNKNQLRYFKLRLQGYEYNEIAKELNVPEGTVKSEIFRAKQLLQEEYLDKNEIFIK
jgi:RNA polymerase sigma factor (sigma-70 family)